MLFAAGLALLFAATPSPAGLPRQPSLASTLDLMRAASGPVWRTRLASRSALSMEGAVENVNSTAYGLGFTSFSCDGALCTGTYFDGERLFDININGTALPRGQGPDPYLRGERTVASLAFLAPDFTTRGGRVGDAGWSSIAGARLRHLVVSDTDGTPFDVFVDPANWHVRVFRDLDGDETFEYRDYRRIGEGITLPFLVLRDGSVLERYAQRSVASGEFTPPVGLLPAPTAQPVSLATDPAFAVPVFACSLGGIDTTCLLDSGNSGLGISPELAKRLNAPVAGSFLVRGLGDYHTDVIRTGPLRLGTLTFPEANYVELQEIHDFGYDVVLGADIFAASTIVLDGTHHRVTFGGPALDGAGTALRVSFSDFVPVVDVTLGNLPTQLAVDTGDESTINLSYDYYLAHADLFAPTGRRAVDGVGGSTIELTGTIGSVGVGDLLLHSQPIGATQALHGTAFGHLGAGFLGNFRVTFDYARGTIRLTPPGPAP
jgi:hypothetical protein